MCGPIGSILFDSTIYCDLYHQCWYQNSSSIGDVETGDTGWSLGHGTCKKMDAKGSDADPPTLKSVSDTNNMSMVAENFAYLKIPRELHLIGEGQG